ncbi:MAG: hypothetical protein DDT40_00604 [candidate division WS2 bacterium]|uniref:TFIIB-type domain-containing protein n=1 Tax=Psychracetigena formicireducens TaxID=2986056 RepID=A0A9E2BFL3_PSYF1|nr:hypothetical protein [Candidatus Psychracetigena formicireducens]MBT9144708.1 hypothetical protein [Candidatus Psychracetigena formicireducens]MBT9150432.1 hypothetical protein [Candidatus Psychracetigena formicireducens]
MIKLPIKEYKMNKTLLNILACPQCKSSLSLVVEEERDDEVITGSLTCTKCGLVFRIIETIPAFI